MVKENIILVRKKAGKRKSFLEQNLCQKMTEFHFWMNYSLIFK